MKKTEIILIGIGILALIMKFFHWPGSSILLVLSLFTLAMLYMYLGFALFNNLRFRMIFKKESYATISTKRIIGAIGTGIVLNISAFGILFKIQNWPGAVIMLWVGFIALAIIAIISWIKIRTSTDNYYSNIVKRVLAFAAICIILISIPTKTWLEWKYPHNPAYIKAILDAQANPDSSALWDKVDAERDKMEGRR